MPNLDSLEYNEIVLKIFGNEREGFHFYNNYNKEKGFSVRRSYCEWDNGHNEMILRKFVCSHEGFREEKELKREIKKWKPRNITHVGCLAKFVIPRDQNTGLWYVKDFIDEHNHPMAQPDLACLYGGYDKVGYTTRDLYNFCHRNKVETVAIGDAQTVINYLAECKRRDPDFFFKYKTDGKGHLEGLLWTFSDAMIQKHSVFVITDGELAMQRAIRLVNASDSQKS
ncbi:protein FAR1-RELATED SEQUENCE 5-like [Miscanthus floridulus]|uniref:protein FAR1-RELATED SEQUENCE 5-like n=1 Tax=Miscanthus floridulus TaxID=154761 RepID=UPI003459EE19